MRCPDVRAPTECKKNDSSDHVKLSKLTSTKMVHRLVVQVARMEEGERRDADEEFVASE